MSLRPGVTLTPIDEVAVLLDERTGRYHQLNASAALVLRSLLAGHGQNEAARDLVRTHPAAGPTAEADIAAHLIALLPPARIRAVLTCARRGATPATAEQARTARDAVIAVSLSCAGEGCLPRSIAAALLCRLGGSWPTWCAGIRVHPFGAHAWIEADGHPVDEPSRRYQVTIVIAPDRELRR
ncbi:lasso peptide biosynthesis PqqD family chaperone [Nonomuraea sp. JJY05]|uniref:lasso peptide biosynthesis PqqD family chaperone n=1 Tax=Nonomuraea sp. JJY05 TaxID=3350255 RepID=UPI00373E4054